MLSPEVIKSLSAPRGTTAHVGISLYGRESRSGHRHLDSRGSFARNALDIFHIATDTSLGNIWKIRIWHDNKGTDAAGGGVSGLISPKPVVITID